MPSYVSQPANDPLIEDCKFYHTIEVPGLGVRTGHWDLRPGIAEYLGDYDFAGKRVLEIGTASGFVCFDMERRGATFDLPEELTYDALPLGDQVLRRDAYRFGLRRIRNGFWLTHRRLNSTAKVVYGHANALPTDLTGFDVGVIANVLVHLQDPIGALIQLSTRCDAIIVTEADWLHGHDVDEKSMIYLDNENPYVWFQLKPALVEAVLKRAGFSSFVRSEHKQLMTEATFHDRPGTPAFAMVPHFTIVARR